MRELLQDTANRATRYLESLDQRSVAPSADAVEALASFDIPLPNEPLDPAKVIEQLDRIGSPATMAAAGPRFFGFVVGGSLPAALAANWLAPAWAQDAAS